MDEPRNDELEDPPAHDEAAGWDEPLLADDLEAAYLRALEATDAIEREMDAQESSVEEAAHSDSAAVDVSSRDREGAEIRLELQPLPDPPVADGSNLHGLSDSAGADSGAGRPRSGERGDAGAAQPVTTPVVNSEPRVSEKQVVEAALFVGGMPLTAKKLSSLFHTDHGFGFVECLLDELNRQYAEEGRPYAITLGEGGYRLSLLPEFESVRNKVFGYGPKDVKLTQDALEVLALVAYKQPITKSQMEALGKANAGSVLRQLLQRELIRIDRAHSPPNSKSKNDPPYVTTPRFLSLFGIGRLSDLPVAEDFAFK
ncbi:MAG: SMC-Scp complex subunit ScpB [Planctomycetaceae bacterium]